MTISDVVFVAGGREHALTIVRRPAAKGLRLSVDPRDATVRLSMPVHASLRSSLNWVAGKRAWVEAELAKVPRGEPIVPGMSLMIAGAPVVLDWNADYRRKAELDDGWLRVGGPAEQLPGRVLHFVKQVALDTLRRETCALAAAHGIVVGAVRVGDPKSRWGSCTASGTIRYSWRLILAPTPVRLATVAHEVAHRLHMDHGRSFHALVARLYGADPAPARQWLRQHGAALHGLGRGND